MNLCYSLTTNKTHCYDWVEQHGSNQPEPKFQQYLITFNGSLTLFHPIINQADFDRIMMIL